jgi:hypothetical protein
LAAEEARQQTSAAQAAGRDLSVRVAVLSDFVQDDPQASFKRDPRLANEAAARAFAAEWSQRKPIAWTGVALYFGLVRSADVMAMNQGRRDAIRAFWTNLCAAGHPRSFQFATDGPGQADAFLAEAAGAGG